jgi:hypothetical protein
MEIGDGIVGYGRPRNMMISSLLLEVEVEMEMEAKLFKADCSCI